MIRKWLAAAGAPAGAQEYEPVERVLGILRCAGLGKNAAASLPGNWEVRRTGARLYCGAAGRMAPGAGGRLTVPGRLALAGPGLLVTAERRAGIVRERGKIGRYPAEASISSRALGRRCLRVRTWRPGDRIEPWGLDGSRKLQEFVGAVRDQFEEAAKKGELPVLMTSPMNRPFVRSIVERFRAHTTVMSQAEVHPKVRLKTVSAI